MLPLRKIILATVVMCAFSMAGMGASNAHNTSGSGKLLVVTQMK